MVQKRFIAQTQRRRNGLFYLEWKLPYRNMLLYVKQKNQYMVFFLIKRKTKQKRNVTPENIMKKLQGVS